MISTLTPESDFSRSVHEKLKAVREARKEIVRLEEELAEVYRLARLVDLELKLANEDIKAGCKVLVQRVDYSGKPTSDESVVYGFLGVEWHAGYPSPVFSKIRRDGSIGKRGFFLQFPVILKRFGKYEN